PSHVPPLAPHSFPTRRSSDLLLAALTDGEDFELLFTVPSRFAVPLVDQWKAKFPEVKLSCIGKTITKPGLFLRDEKGIRGFNAQDRKSTRLNSSHVAISYAVF